MKIYKLNKDPVTKQVVGVLNKTDNIFVGVDANNWQEYLDWLAEGNIPEPEDVISIATLKSNAHTWINDECRKRIYARFNLEKQLSIGRGIIIETPAEKDWTAAMLAVCNNATDTLIPACVNESGIEAVKAAIVWPV